MNFLDVTGERNGADGTSLAVGGSRVAAPQGAPQGPVRLGIRAEAIELTEAGSPGAAPAHVEVVEPLGAATLLTTTVDGQELKVQVPPHVRVSSGDTVHLSFAERAIRLYDPETGLGLDLR